MKIISVRVLPVLLERKMMTKKKRKIMKMDLVALWIGTRYQMRSHLIY